jgi:hypothetical protein
MGPTCIIYTHSIPPHFNRKHRSINPMLTFLPLWLHRPCEDLGHLTHGRFNLFTLGTTPLDERRARRKTSTYTYNITQKHKHKNFHALIGIRAHDLSVQAIKAHASDGAATGKAYRHFNLDETTATVRISGESPCGGGGGGVGSGTVRGESVLVGGLKCCYWSKPGSYTTTYRLSISWE